jgi:hypothetical protein
MSDEFAWRFPGGVEPADMKLERTVPLDRSPKLKVIGAGLPRTATMALAVALGHLLDDEVCHGGSICLQGPERECCFRTSTAAY